MDDWANEMLGMVVDMECGKAKEQVGLDQMLGWMSGSSAFRVTAGIASAAALIASVY